MNCILCESSDAALFKVKKKPERDYFHCSECDLIFADPSQRLDASEEKARYDHHQNEETQGYVSFLNPLVKEIHSYFTASGIESTKISVLDFGCGPTALLSKLLNEKGYRTNNYDLFYFPDKEAFKYNYHLITSTEVWEHLHNPKVEIERMLRVLKSSGLLAVMTSAHHGEAVFSDWYYRRDLTHVTFFSEKTMNWIARKYDLRLLKQKSPYWIFQKV